MPIERALLSTKPAWGGLWVGMVGKTEEPAHGERVFLAVLHPSADIRNAPFGEAKLKLRTRQSVTMVGRLVPDAEHGDRRVWFEVLLEDGDRGYIHQMFLKSVSDHRGPMRANTPGAAPKLPSRQADEVKMFAVAAILILAIFSLVVSALSSR